VLPVDALTGFCSSINELADDGASSTLNNESCGPCRRSRGSRRQQRPENALAPLGRGSRPVFHVRYHRPRPAARLPHIRPARPVRFARAPLRGALFLIQNPEGSRDSLIRPYLQVADLTFRSHVRRRRSGRSRSTRAAGRLLAAGQHGYSSIHSAMAWPCLPSL